MTTLVRLLTTVLRAAILLSPAAMAVAAFLYLIHRADEAGTARRVDYTSTASVDDGVRP